MWAKARDQRLRGDSNARITAPPMRVSPESSPTLPVARHLHMVRYEIRGPLARRAQELERDGYEVIKLNIGNPAAFGFRTPETMRIATIENLSEAEGYCHQKGIFPAREAVVMDTQTQGIAGVTAEDVFIGNGVSELILMTMEALLEPGDEVVMPAPDYPLWTAAVVITGGKPVYYPCRPEAGFIPDPDEVARLVTPRCKALVLINPNNPTGAVYPREVVEKFVRIAEQNQIVLFSDEIYNRILYDGAQHVPVATLCRDTLCATFGGLSKVYRACGFRTGWVFFSGRKDHATDYLNCSELLASLRLCANVPGQWAVQTALGGVQSIYELTAPTGRLGRQRLALPAETPGRGGELVDALHAAERRLNRPLPRHVGAEPQGGEKLQAIQIIGRMIFAAAEKHPTGPKTTGAVHLGEAAERRAEGIAAQGGDRYVLCAVVEDAVIDLVRKKNDLIFLGDLDESLDHFPGINGAGRVIRIDEHERFASRRHEPRDLVRIGDETCLRAAGIVDRLAPGDDDRCRPQRVIRGRHHDFVARLEQRFHRHQDELGNAVADEDILGGNARDPLRLRVHDDGFAGRED